MHVSMRMNTFTFYKRGPGATAPPSSKIDFKKIKQHGGFSIKVLVFYSSLNPQSSPKITTSAPPVP